MIDAQLCLRILRVIQEHPKADPVTGHALAEMFQTSVRVIQHVVEELRAAGHKVASSMRPPMGYYLATGPEEMLETVEQYRLRARHFFATANKLSDWGSLEPTIWEAKEEAA